MKLALSLFLIHGGICGETLRSGSPIESHWPEVSQLQITWKENWDATYKANWDQWNTEAQQLKNNNDKTRYLGVRRARLLDSLIDRFPEETEKRNEARFELAGYLHKKGFVGSGNRYLDQIIVESPGSLDLAVRALRTILEKTPVVRAHQIAQGEAWIEYAARRMLTVYRYGDDSYLEATALALQSLTELRLSQGRWLDARQTLSLLRELSVLDDSVRSLEDKLDGAALRDVPLQAARTAPPYEQDRWRNQLVVAQRELLDGKGDDLQMILSADEQRRRILSAGGNRQTSMWTLVRQFLLEQDQDALAPLRKSQEEEAAFQMGSLAASPSDAELFSVYRRFPLANSSHKALVRLGLGSLVQGHIGIARRSFQDALTFSNNGEILSRARSGLWLALAQKAEDETELRESFDGISLKQEFPWFGAKPTASTIREELMAGRRPPSVRPMQASALRPMALPLPEHPAWDHPLLEITHPDILEGLTPLTGQIQALRNGVLVSGPNLLAWYEGELDRPKWLKSNPLSMGVSGMASTRVRSTRTFTVPGPVRPSSRGGRIYARWGLRSSKGTMRSVAAFDAETGELIWTTAKEPNWHERSPVSDPVAADGRVFVIVLQRGKSPAPFFLVCLDAQDGKLMWEQHLADQVITQSGEANLFGRGMANYHFDFVHFGNRVTVEAGAVYCQANMGVVAKLDARDGHIDWLHLYERPAELGGSARRFLRRQGSPPLIDGNTVLFAPRDYAGAMALNRETGVLLWDNPDLPSDEVVGLRRGIAVLRGTNQIIGVAPAAGRLVWREHFHERIRCVAFAEDEVLLVSTRSGLFQFDASTGQELKKSDWHDSGPFSSMAAHGKRVVGIAGPGKKPSSPKRLSAKPKSSSPSPLVLPLKLSWRRARPNPRLWHAPADSPSGTPLLLYSRGTLECFRADHQGQVLWRRLIERGFELERTGTSILITYPRQIIALHASTGNVQWEVNLPFAMSYRKTFGNNLAAMSGTQLAVIDLATGKTRWQGGPEFFRDIIGRADPVAAASAGEFHRPFLHRIGDKLHLIGDLNDNRGLWHASMRVQDGKILSARRLPLPHKVRQGAARAVGDSFVLGDWPVYRVPLDSDSEPAFWKLALPTPRRRKPLHYWNLMRIQGDGPFVRVWFAERRGYLRNFCWTLRLDDPEYQLLRNTPGFIREGKLYDIHERAFVVTDLASRKELKRYVVPAPDQIHQECVDFWETPKQIVVASHAPGDSLRLDAFDRQTRQHLAVQSLPAGGFRQLLLPAKGDVDWKRAQLARGKGVLFVATAHGLNAYVPAGDERQQGGPHLLAYKALVKPTIDGSLDDWSGRRPAIIEPETSEESIASNSHTRQPGWDSSPAKLFFSHDSGFFFVGLSVPAETPVNHTGPGHLGGGDWLEIGITAGKNIRRWGFGIGKHGRPVWDDLGHGGRPPDSQLAIEYDALQQRLHYELAIPIQEVRPYHQRLFLSLMVWDEGPDGMSRRRFNWGGALRGAGIEAEHHGVAFTHSKQMEAEEAELAFVHAMPETRAAWSVFEELAAVRGSYSSDGLSELYRDYLERHPNSVFVNRILVRLAQSARQLSPQVAKNILSFAESCGVPPSVRNRFERQFKSRLSFQVHRDFSRRPSALRIHFNYSTRESAWRNAAWGYTHQHDALRAYGSMPDAGVWRPLAVPLMHVNMHDDPVHGLAIYHHGRGIVHWDRVALHLGEAERILIDDETPTGGKTSGDWTWTNKLAASGEKGFANRPNIGSLWQRLKEPATDHIVPPVTGAFLSQWVYLDAKRPPAWVGISLHDGSDWNFRLLWGSVWRGQSYPKEQDTSNLYFGHVIHRPDWSWLSNGFPVQKGRYMGRLPKPGEWQELQIPFSWTPFLDREVPGIRFEQFGGKVTWDRTSILAHGRDRIIIEDDVPPGEVKPQWKWTDELKKSGGSARVQIADNEYQFHHVYPLDEPIDTHLSGDAKEVVAALEKKLLLVANSAHRERLFDAGMRIVKARLKDPRQSIDAAQRLLKARVYPDSLRGAHLLGFLHQAHDRARQKNPRQSVETFVQQVGVPTDARYEYRRRYGAESGFSIRHWQILGSFPNEKCSGYFAAWPPEKDGIQLSTEYTSQYQNYRWRTFQSKEDFINLADAFPTDKLAEGNQESEIRIPESEVRNRGVAYAGCWIHVPEKQPAVLEFGASDGFRVWLNRNSILGNHRHGEASPRQVVKRVELPKGWSEMLVKVSHYKGGWGFTLQIIDSEGNGPPKGFKSQAVPPGADTETGPVKRVVLKGSNLLAKFKKEFRIPAGAFDKHRKRIRHGYDRATGLPLEIVHTATGMHFVFIPAGEFLMGSPESETGRNENEGPQHRVRITRAYYMGKYEVTQREWKSVMGTNPSHYAGESRPVELVSWHDCQGFVRKLNLGTPTFGLPTEAQWEYACRAGTKTRMFYGDDPGYRELNRYAWKGRQAKGQTHPVGQRRPNGWGIYDLYGNVWEWTQDGFGRYTEGLALDPAGRPESEMKVERSGSFQSGNAAFRSASRDPKPPDRRYKGLGLRLVVRY